MGSNCSSRQSEKDSASVKSEDSQNEQNDCYEKAEKEKTENITSVGGAAGEEKIKMKEKLRLVESDFSSCGDEGTGVGTPLSSTVSAACASDGLNRGKLFDRGEEKKEELPDLDLMKEETTQLLEGKTLQKRFRTNKILVVLLGRLDDCGKGTRGLMKSLSQEISSKVNAKGVEILLLNPHDDVSLYSVPFSPSDLVAEYIKEQSGYCPVFIFLLRGTNAEVYELPPSLNEEDFQSILEGAGSQEDQTLLEKWYIKDHYKEDSRKLQPVRSVFPEILSDKKEEYEKSCNSWRSEHDQILGILKKVSQEGEADLRLYTTIEKDLQLVKDLPVDIPFKIILIRKDAKRTPVEDKVDQFLQTIGDDVVRELAQKIFSENRTGFDILRPKLSAEEETGEWWKEITTSTLASVLDCVESGFSVPKIKTLNPMEDGINLRLTRELWSHYNCSGAIVSGKVSHLDTYLNKVQKYIGSSSRKPLLIVGDIGSGKSVLASSVSNQCQEWFPNSCIMSRYIGLTSNSLNLDGIIYYLVEQSLATHGHPLNFDSADMGTNLKEIWAKATSFRPIVVLLDGVDQITNEKSTASSLLELVSDLPENVKLVLTAQENSVFHEEFLQRVQSEEDCVLKLEPPSEEFSETLLSDFMSRNNQNLSKTVWENIKRKHQSPLPPLYFFILSQLLLAGTKEHENCSSNLENEIEYYFKTLENLYSKTVLQAVLGCLALTRAGLLESEITSILQSANSSTVDNAMIDWLYLRRLLRPLLSLRWEGELVLTSLSSSLRDFVAKYFLDTEEKINKCFTVLRKNVFTLEEKAILNISLQEHEKQSLKHVRSVQESLLILDWKSKDQKTLFNLSWLYKLVENSGPFKVIQELDLGLSKDSDPELSTLREIVRLSSFSLVYDSSQFFSQIYGRLKWRPQDDSCCPRLSAFLASASQSPLPCLLPLSPCLSGASQEKSSENSEEKAIYINAIFRIPGNSHHVIAISTSRSQVTVWNIIDMEIVRTLNGINQPRKLEMIDDYRCLLLCGRELRIFNLNEGTFLMKLREVMNQKMPFFGLRDGDHVVALSRNRMYVNMMNLTQGNCVTTFKVGEDRFLNSLLVSENGKICVCGDDTQKPSALLVWDLELRKLMYDLRIPHHEFATRLAAITIEGHYVCCVCKEVNEPAPNFIVVYDLQSGTLFKRWKPDVNTISITISTEGTCVIVGLEDSSVMAFDLITGNRRWTVFGHTYPPDTFRLDQKGLVLVSYDSQGKDQSLRVWNIHTGESLATLTPDQKITACEITCDGKAVVLAFEDQDSIFTFLLLHKEDQANVTVGFVPYGDVEHKGKVADFSQT